MSTTTHVQLDCGVELAVLELPDRRAEAMQICMLTGTANEPVDKLGLSHVVEQAIDKGTELHDGRGLSDAFDEIGAGRGSWCGREATGFDSLCLPEFFARNVELHAEFLRRAVFPADSCDVAIELARQELLLLQDDPAGLADKLIARQAYGPILGRHATGEGNTLESITRDDVVGLWKQNYCAGRMLVSVAGPLEAAAVVDVIKRHFSGFGSATPSHREGFAVEFEAATTHHQKDTEQQQVALALPGVPLNHPDHAAERLLVGVLSGGMSARLFTEVREKQGLVYWVDACQEHPRKAGMIFVGAASTPENVAKTFATLVHELGRVKNDVTAEEIERALTGIMVRADIRNDMTRTRCSEQMRDLIHYGHPVPWEEKLARLQAVTASDIKRYCETHGFGRQMSVVTLGPRPLDGDRD